MPIPRDQDFNVINGEVLPRRVMLWDWHSDGLIVLCSALLLFAVRQLLTRFAIRPLAARRLTFLQGSKLTRFCETAWFSIYYTLQMAVGVYLLMDKEWVYQPEKALLGWPHHTGSDSTDGTYRNIRRFYLVQLGFYAQAFISIVFIDERFNDFVQMVVHHASTIYLILLSLICGWYRFGALTLFLHDAVDVLLFQGKTFHEARKQWLANAYFALFIISYALLRLVFFPYIVYLTLCSPGALRLNGTADLRERGETYFVYRYHEPASDVNFELTSFGVCVRGYCLSGYYTSWACLATLICLHVFWYYLILKLAAKTLGNQGDVPGDIRHSDFKEKSSPRGGGAGSTTTPTTAAAAASESAAAGQDGAPGSPHSPSLRQRTKKDN